MHQSLFANGRVDVANFFEQDPIELAAIVYNDYRACDKESEM